MKNLYLLYGKDESVTEKIANSLRQDYELKVVQPYTTRPKRYKTESGYIFTNDELLKDKDLFVSVVKDGYKYGVSLTLINGNDVFPIYTDCIQKCVECGSYERPVKIIYVYTLNEELTDVDEYFIGLDGVSDMTIFHINFKSSCDRIYSFICDLEGIKDGR